MRLGLKIVAGAGDDPGDPGAADDDPRHHQERQAYRAQAVDSIARSYAGAQAFVGPVLVVPYVETVEVEEKDAQGVARKVQREQDGRWTFFPETLDVGGVLKPGTRRRGLHEVRVYEWQGQAEARFDARIPADADPPRPRRIGRPWLELRRSPTCAA